MTYFQLYSVEIHAEEHTFEFESCEVVLKIVNGRKEHLYMQDELLSHPDGLEVLPVADLAQHVGNARCTGLLKGRQYTMFDEYRLPTEVDGRGNSRPYPIHLLFHPDLLLPQ